MEMETSNLTKYPVGVAEQVGYLGCFRRAGEKGTSFSDQSLSLIGVLSIFPKTEDVSQGHGGCKQRDTSSAQRCFGSTKELRNQNLKEFRALCWV